MKGCTCKYCSKEFPNVQSFNEHVKHGCKYKTDYVVGLERQISTAEKVRRETILECAKVADSYTGAVCGCQKMLAQAIRNLTNQNKVGE